MEAFPQDPVIDCPVPPDNAEIYNKHLSTLILNDHVQDQWIRAYLQPCHRAETNASNFQTWVMLGATDVVVTTFTTIPLAALVRNLDKTEWYTTRQNVMTQSVTADNQNASNLVCRRDQPENNVLSDKKRVFQRLCILVLILKDRADFVWEGLPTDDLTDKKFTFLTWKFLRSGLTPYSNTYANRYSVLKCFLLTWD